MSWFNFGGIGMELRVGTSVGWLGRKWVFYKSFIWIEFWVDGVEIHDMNRHCYEN